MSKGQSRLLTFEVDAAVEQSFQSYCRVQKVESSRLLGALMYDFLHRRDVGASQGANLVRNLEQYEAARQWQRRPGRLKRRKHRLTVRLKELVAEMEAVFAGLDDGESSPVQERRQP